MILISKVPHAKNTVGKVIIKKKINKIQQEEESQLFMKCVKTELFFTECNKKTQI